MHDIEDEQDEWILELPPLGDASDDDDELSPSDVGVDTASTVDPASKTDEESVGLDDSTGLDDDAPLFSLDLPPADVVDDAGVDVIPLAEELEDDAEYGWTDTGASEEKWDPSGLDLPTLAPLGRDATGGEEGVDEDDELDEGDDDAVPNLPPLRGDVGEEEEDEEDELFLIDPEQAHLLERANDLPPRIEARHELLLGVRVRDLALGQAIWAVGVDGVHRGVERISSSGLDGTPQTIEVARDHSWVVVGTERGCYRSVDWARSFKRIPDLGAGTVALVRASDESVWALGPTGRVQRSDDGGVTWSRPLLLTRAVALASPGRGMAALCAPASARPQLAASTDGGRRWTACEAPTLERPPAEGSYAFAALGDDMALASSADAGGPFVSTDRGRSWRRLLGLPPARALALSREPALTIYAAHEGAAGTAIARHVPGRESESGVIHVSPARVWALVRDDDGSILAATDAGLIRFPPPGGGVS